MNIYKWLYTKVTYYFKIGEEYVNEDDIEYVIEKLDTDEEESIKTQEDSAEIKKGEIDQELCAQLTQFSDDENSEPVIKKIKLSEVIISQIIFV